MVEIASKAGHLLIDLHADPMIPEGCTNIFPIHVKSERNRCSPSKILLVSKDEVSSKHFAEVISYFKMQSKKCVANANARDFYLKNPETVPKNWNGRIYFPGTFFVVKNKESAFVIPYIDVSEGVISTTGEASILSSFKKDTFFAYYDCY